MGQRVRILQMQVVGKTEDLGCLASQLHRKKDSENDY